MTQTPPLHSGPAQSGARSGTRSGAPSDAGPGSGTNASTDAAPGARPRPALNPLWEKQRRELWLYMAVTFAAIELLLAVGAVFYGFMAGRAFGHPGAFLFPWLSWGAAAVALPALILLLAHFADVGLFRSPGRERDDAEWQQRLPERLRRIYIILKGAPVALVLLGLVGLGAALVTLDGALSALADLAGALRPYLPHILGGLLGLAALIVICVAWLHYRTRRLIAEYQFRREVLEKTGVIIVDKGSVALPPGYGYTDVPYAIAEGPPQAALPAGPATGFATDVPDRPMEDPEAKGEDPARRTPSPTSPKENP